MALVGLAEVLRKRGDPDAALHHSTEGIERCRRLVFALPLTTGLVTLAWIHQASGATALAMETIEEAERTVPSPDIVSLHNPAPAERARLLLAQDRIDEAVSWTEERGLTEDDEFSYPQERDYLVLARVLLAQHLPDRAIGLLDRLDRLAESQGRVQSHIQIQTLRSLAFHAARDQQGAVDALSDALALARPEDFVSVFADEGAVMTGLLRKLVLARPRAPSGMISDPLRRQVLRILQASEPATARTEHADQSLAGMVEPLTDRELEVLRLLAEGRQNREVAEHLVVTLETVKKHVTHILGKLGAANRTQAVVQARRLGLIPLSLSFILRRDRGRPSTCSPRTALGCTCCRNVR